MPLSRLGILSLALVLSAAPSFAATAKAAKKAPAKEAVLAAGTGVSIVLTNGSKVDGIFQSEADGVVWVEVDGGEAGIDRSTIARMAASKTPDIEFKERGEGLAQDDAKGWWELAQWAETKELFAAARSAARKAIKIDPDHHEARKYLGYEKVDGRWLQGDDVHRARGLVPFEGQWVMPEEVAELKKAREEKAKQEKLDSMTPVRASPVYKYEEPPKAKRPFSGWVDR